jgi:Fe2+ transport system protein FeoA
MLTPLTLADLEPGQSGRIEHSDTSDPGVLRLMVLGLVEDTPVRFIQAAIGGDPMEFSIFGICISLRREQARKFAVTRIDVGD